MKVKCVHLHPVSAAAQAVILTYRPVLFRHIESTSYPDPYITCPCKGEAPPRPYWRNRMRRWGHGHAPQPVTLVAIDGLLARRKVVEENKLQNQVVAGELFRQGPEGNRGADAGEGGSVERVGA